MILERDLFLAKFTIKKIKEEVVLSTLGFYGRFLRTRIMTTPMMATKTNSPAIAGTKYISTFEGACVGAGVAVGCSAMTLNAVVADDGQYALVPANVATTW